MAMHSDPKLHFYFFPFMSPGHIIPLVDMARQFARHDTNVRATIVLPHLNEPQYRATIDGDRRQGLDISIRQVTLPIAQVGLPDDFVSLTSITSPDMYMKFEEAIQLLRGPVERFLIEDRPDCMISDFFISWTGDLAAKLRIPRIIFHVAGFFPLCVYHSFVKHGLHEGLDSDDDTVVVVPGLPNVVRMTKRQLPDFLRYYNPAKPPTGIMEITKEADEPCYGVIFNSFKELEHAYIEHYRANIRSKAWHVGPVWLAGKDRAKKARRDDDDYCLDWLSTKKPKSVVYVGFGTLSLFSSAQLREIAVGLEMCGWDFIWLAKTDKKKKEEDGEEEEEWLPEGYEKRIQGRGLVIKSWAPQVLILEHESVGGFLTHCGWNSFLEGLIAGQPMITWPISYEQFESEKLVTEVLKIGVSVGNEDWSGRLNVDRRALVKAESIAQAVNKVMVSGEESLKMRSKVKALSDEAKKAVEKGGSSYRDLDSLMEELRLIKK